MSVRNRMGLWYTIVGSTFLDTAFQAKNIEQLAFSGGAAMLLLMIGMWLLLDERRAADSSPAAPIE